MHHDPLRLRSALTPATSAAVLGRGVKLALAPIRPLETPGVHGVRQGQVPSAGGGGDGGFGADGGALQYM